MTRKRVVRARRIVSSAHGEAKRALKWEPLNGRRGREEIPANNSAKVRGLKKSKCTAAGTC